MKPWEPSVAVSRIAHGVSFVGDLFVHDPAYLGDSRAIPLSAATSGNAAASTFGGELRFARPVRHVEAKLSPGFISYNGVSAFGRVTMTGYDARNQVRARSTADVRFAAETIEQIENFVPVKISLTSRIPISRVTIQGPRFYIDDLKWTDDKARRPLRRKNLEEIGLLPEVEGGRRKPLALMSYFPPEPPSNFLIAPINTPSTSGATLEELGSVS